MDDLVEVDAKPPSLMSALEEAAPSVRKLRKDTPCPDRSTATAANCIRYEVTPSVCSRCRHGQTTNQLQAEMVRRRGYALSLVRARPAAIRGAAGAAGRGVRPRPLE